MQVQDLSFKMNNKRNSKARVVAIYDKVERKMVNAARANHRARLAQLVEMAAWENV